MVRTDQVKLVSINYSIIEFETKYKDEIYSIIYKREEERWSCTCAFGSLWGMGKKDCAHIKACKIMLNKYEK